jgi:hypothetical protein
MTEPGLVPDVIVHLIRHSLKLVPRRERRVPGPVARESAYGCGRGWGAMSSCRGRVVATVGALTVAALVWAAAVQAGTASCQKDVALITAGASGPLSCVTQGTPTIVVGRSTTLKLKTMSTALTAVRTAEHYTYGGRTSKAEGVFIMLTVTVTNNTSTPRVFNPENQVVLAIDNNPNFLNNFLPQHLTLRELEAGGPIVRPGQSTTGVLVFDVDKSTLGSFPGKAGLAFVNFGQNADKGLVTQLGIIDLAGAA